jgi:hypothetical protein
VNSTVDTTRTVFSTWLPSDHAGRLVARQDLEDTLIRPPDSA